MFRRWNSQILGASVSLWLSSFGVQKKVVTQDISVRLLQRPTNVCDRCNALVPPNWIDGWLMWSEVETKNLGCVFCRHFFYGLYDGKSSPFFTTILDYLFFFKLFPPHRRVPNSSYVQGLRRSWCSCPRNNHPNPIGVPNKCPKSESENTFLGSFPLKYVARHQNSWLKEMCL